MKREQILKRLWECQDKAFDLMDEYDSLPHHYGDNVLYQAEAYVIQEIGNNPGTTTSEIALILNKTTSACSQIIKKLLNRGLVEQIRNEENRRIYNLVLTEEGLNLYKEHIKFNETCQKLTFEMLDEFTDEELMIHVKVQEAINKAYQGDVNRSKEK